MRREVWIVAAFLLAGAAILTFWPIRRDIDPSPPGQYPLHSERFKWPMTERKKAYRPSQSMGEETVTYSGGPRDPKTRCGTDNTCPLSLSF
jgi:hypothetical protein